MVSIYFWMHHDTSVKPEKVHTPFLSRSSTKTVLSRRGGAGDGQELPCRSMVEISSISMDKNHLSSAAYTVSNYRLVREHVVCPFASFCFYADKINLVVFISDYWWNSWSVWMLVH